MSKPEIKKPSLEMADILRRYQGAYVKKHQPPKDHLKVISKIIDCRTAALGGHMRVCSQGCGYTDIAYNSCRNRHCPKCQYAKTKQWIEARQSELLPVPYFHVVFTLPTTRLLPIIRANKKRFYELMFKAASQTILTLAKDPKWLGADIGAICVLHTWSQKLRLHPHIHCIVPAGGFDSTKNEWITPKNEEFFVHFSVLSGMFKKKLLAFLKKENKKGRLSFFDNEQYLKDPVQLKRFCAPLYHLKWISYAKQSFNGPSAVINYLGNYVHKIAISNYRLVKIENDRVFFKYRDRSDNNTEKITHLHALDFIKAFLQHVLPYNFIKVRSFGILSNPNKKETLSRVHASNPGLQQDTISKKTHTYMPLSLDEFLESRDRCPNCLKGTLLKSTILLPSKKKPLPP